MFLTMFKKKTLPEAQRTQGIESITQIITHGKKHFRGEMKYMSDYKNHYNCRELETPGPIDRTPETPGSGKNRVPEFRRFGVLGVLGVPESGESRESWSLKP